MINNSNNPELGKTIKQRRLLLSLTLQELSVLSGISASHLGRIERGERYPSASILKQIATPLGFTENELFSLAGYLSLSTADTVNGNSLATGHFLDPQVRLILSQEPVEVQHAVVGVLNILKSIARMVKGQE